MNSCDVSGWIQGEPEVRTTKDCRRILNFEIAVDGDNDPYVQIGFILRGDAIPDLHAGTKVHVRGALMHHRVRGLFVAATKIHVLQSDGATSKIENTERLTQ
jgi:hypothetical protein